MNRDFANNRVSQLPIQMAGIVHAEMVNGTSLSMNIHTVIPIAK